MRAAHIFPHVATNAGDIYLKHALQVAFRERFPELEFENIEMRKIFTDADIENLNRFDFIVIGGGGVFLRDTFPNTVSDWQWGCSAEHVSQITKPIIVFAVGYNRFRGQEGFDEQVFTRQLSTLVGKSSFFSLRNSGSVESIKAYLPNTLKNRISLTFCPSILFPSHSVQRFQKPRRAVLLLAGDRLERRHPRLDEFLAKLTGLVRELQRADVDVTIAGHQNNDFWYLDALAEFELPVKSLDGEAPSAVMNFYSNIDVVIGDRGHAQMIPFGLGCNIVSLVSHNKLQWFLDDIGLPDHGVEESDPALVDKVLRLAMMPGTEFEESRESGMRRILSVHETSMDVIHDRIMSAV